MKLVSICSAQVDIMDAIEMSIPGVQRNQSTGPEESLFFWFIYLLLNLNFMFISDMFLQLMPRESWIQLKSYSFV